MDGTELRLIGVGLTHGGRVVLDGLDLTLSERRIGLIGRNGAGKSQSLRLLAGLAAPDRGAVRIGGVDPHADRRAALAAVGVLFQNPDHQIIFPTVDEELAFGLTALGVTGAEAAARIAAMLARFGRGAWAGRHVQSLSQGQRHLLCLMAVLLMEPGTILLDEPYAGLDLPTVMRLHAILRGLPQRLIHVSHDLEALADHDRVIWLDAGKVRADGAPGQVIQAYRAAMQGVADDDRAEF